MQSFIRSAINPARRFFSVLVNRACINSLGASIGKLSAGSNKLTASSHALSVPCPKNIPHVLETIEISKSGEIQIKNLRITG